MTRSNWILTAALVAALGATGGLWAYNRALRRDLDKLEARFADPWRAPAAGGQAAVTDGEPAAAPFASRPILRLGSDRPALPDAEAAPAPAPSETRAERRARRQDELAVLLGRQDGESDDAYRARLLPMMKTFLEQPRATIDEERRAAERLADVSDEQREKLDAAFTDVYAELVTYTNEAISGGDLTPYARNVPGVLQYTGGLGAILQGANQRIGQVLSPGQLATIADTGFDWAEYLGLHAPWEQLTPPPPPPPQPPLGG